MASAVGNVLRFSNTYTEPVSVPKSSSYWAPTRARSSESDTERPKRSPYTTPQAATMIPRRANARLPWASGLRFYGGLAHLFFCITGVIYLLSEREALVSASFEQLFGLVAAGAFVNLAGIALTIRRGLWSFSGIFQSVFWLFHFGLVTTVALGMGSGTILNVYTLSWLHTEAAKNAAVLALVGALACAAGIQLVARFAAFGAQRPVAWRARMSDARFERALAKVGAVMTAGSALVWLAVIISGGGVALLFASYGTYLNLTGHAARVISLVWLGFGFGLVIVTTALPSPWRRFGLIVLGAFVLVALPLGLRGEILFPLAAAGAVRAMRRKPLSWRTTLILAVAGLVMIAALRDIRAVSLGAVEREDVGLNLWDGVAELGGSLQPVQKVVSWHDAGEDYIWGASYWAPIDRGLYHFIPGWNRVPAEEDLRLMNVLVARRVGMIGFSPVAEAFHNFGPVGVAAVLFVIGLIVGGLDRLSPSRFNQLLAGAVFLPLLINVRNSFVFVPFHIGLILTLLVVVRWYTRVRMVHAGRAASPAQPVPVAGAEW